MSLDFPFPIYGTVTSDSSALPSTNVNIVDIPTHSLLSVTTNSGGNYSKNLQSIATSGNLLGVWVVSGENYHSTSFILRISGAAKRINLSLPDDADDEGYISTNTINTYDNKIYSIAGNNGSMLFDRTISRYIIK